MVSHRRVTLDMFMISNSHTNILSFTKKNKDVKAPFYMLESDFVLKNCQEQEKDRHLLKSSINNF